MGMRGWRPSATLLTAMIAPDVGVAPSCTSPDDLKCGLGYREPQEQASTAHPCEFEIRPR